MLDKEFVLYTDYAALREVLTKKGEDFTHRQLRWYERLEPYTFTMVHIKSKENVVSDALSRIPAFYEVNAIEFFPQAPHTQINSDAMSEAAHKDAKYIASCADKMLCEKLRLKVTEQGMLETFEGQVCVPNDDVLRYKIVLEAHEPLFAGHFSAHKTLELVR